ncbi:MAG: 16S rRNA (cytidine(1402)-2'-O)-methyltransferase [Steroidobacteraceae bacterium]
MAATVGRLDIVATPIGNLADFSQRARDTLLAADLIAAEDTRRTGQMLTLLGISRPLVSLHDHNERARLAPLLERLAAGGRIALVSDAGTPLVSDPGYALVQAAIDGGHLVQAIPGPSAVLAALASAGLPTDRFCFDGFLPVRGRQRETRLQQIAAELRTIVLFEAPHRIVATLNDLAAACGAQRRAAVARELTKTFETVYRGTLGELIENSAQDANFARGEITIVLQGAPEDVPQADEFLRRLLTLLLEELPPPRVAALAAQLTGRKRSDVYELIARRKSVE